MPVNQGLAVVQFLFDAEDLVIIYGQQVCLCRSASPLGVCVPRGFVVQGLGGRCVLVVYTGMHPTRCCIQQLARLFTAGFAAGYSACQLHM